MTIAPAARQPATSLTRSQHAAPAGPPLAQSDADARQRLLDAAGPLFAARGYDGTTVREIVEAAGVNLAAVNYYFRGKQGLYNAVLTEGYAALLAATRDGPVPAGPFTPEQARAWLVEFVGAMVERALDPRRPHWLFEIMMREMVAPTPALDELVARFIRPQHAANCQAIAALTGLEASEQRVSLAGYSIVAQVLMYKHCPQMVQRLGPVETATPQARRALATHIAEFSLAGLASLIGREHSRSQSTDQPGGREPL